MENRDSEIRNALRRDDMQALELIWDAYGARLHGFLVALLRSHAEAEDVLQDLFVRMAAKRRVMAEARSLCAYVFAMARNGAAEHCRTRRPDETADAAANMQLAAVDPGDENALDPETVERALATLPAEQREVVVLKLYREMTFEEIGEALGISLNTAASRYRYALEKLRDYLKDKGEPRS